MLQLRTAVVLLGLASGSAFAQGGAPAQGRSTIDEGTFLVTVGGASQTENFKIVRDNGLITATGALLGGAQQITSSLTTDLLGTPIKYDIAVRASGVPAVSISVTALAGRLTALSNNQRGDQSMHEYPLSAGHCFILDEALVHQLYFVAKSGGGSLQIVEPRESRTLRLTLSSKGLEPVSVGGRSLTATHYSLGEGPARREFWVDEAGRLLRAEIPSRQLVAIREDPPR